MKVSFPDITFHRGDVMYRIDDRSSAIKEIQEYLRIVGNKNILVVPTGIYDENTRLSVLDFQINNEIAADGIVNIITFIKLYDAYSFALENKKNKEKFNLKQI